METQKVGGISVDILDSMFTVIVEEARSVFEEAGKPFDRLILGKLARNVNGVSVGQMAIEVVNRLRADADNGVSETDAVGQAMRTVMKFGRDLGLLALTADSARN